MHFILVVTSKFKIKKGLLHNFLYSEIEYCHHFCSGLKLMSKVTTNPILISNNPITICGEGNIIFLMK